MEPHPSLSASRYASICRAQTDKMRAQMFHVVQVEKNSPNAIWSPDGRHSLRWKKSRFQSIDCDYTETKRRRWQSAVFDASGTRIAVADVEEFSLRKFPRHNEWSVCMDDVDARYGEIADAFSEGWDWPECSLLDYGNLAVLEHVAASKTAGSPMNWTPLLNEFIERYVFREAFVVIGEVYPYDVERAAKQLIDMQYPDQERDVRKCEKRWDAKLKFFGDNIGLIPFAAIDGRPRWMYRLREPDDLDQQPRFGQTEKHEREDA
ncbi:hypothetical protein OIU34_23630 [Pararhizobium sp. BT-229]|uniref:hypothetical protein n=1 Tax=Pararhizobium sp. BT-229 TaxID=2986923 RepID=UPI0021F719E1|nr:hypothetical protein [Pararhizobium sp. BT-229]MCV9964888.1 hypothetical protein [Pararhizobium sp. BT-229]